MIKYMTSISHKNNFIYLLFSLIVFLFSAALVAEIPTGLSKDIFSIVTILMLIVSIKSMKTDATWRWAVFTIIAFYILLAALQKFFDHYLYTYFDLVILLLYFVGSFVAAARLILFVGEIDMNKIVGSLALYILLGLIWTVIYLLILTADHHAFSGIESANWQVTFSRAAYFSFVTLATVGYGDILPTNHLAEFFVYMEAIIGVFYMAIIVASLITHHRPSNRSQN